MPTTKPNPNFFAGSPLNRLSWLRPSHPFLNALVLFPATRWIIFNGGQPLVVTMSGSSTSAGSESATSNVKHQLAHVSTDDVLPLLGPQPFFGQAEEDGQLVPNSVRTLGSIRHRGPRIVFLGLHQPETSEAGGEPNGDGGTLTLSPDVQEDALEQAVAGLNGTPFFCVDVADVEQSVVDVVLKQAVERWSWMDARAVMACLDAPAAGMYAQARSMADWNQRNKVSAFALSRGLVRLTRQGKSSVRLAVRLRTRCGAAGSFLATPSCRGSTERAGDRVRPSQLFYTVRMATRTAEQLFHRRRGLHNFMHPRTDSVVITIAIDQSGEKILLGKNVCSCYSPFRSLIISTRESRRKSFLGGSFLLSQDSWSQGNRSRTRSEGRCGKKPVSWFGMFGIILTSHGSVSPSYMHAVPG